MKAHYTDDRATVFNGDCLDVMRGLADESVDAIVTDPPYGLGFMGRKWDHMPPGVEWAEECLRVLKPGGHLLAFGGSRTWHRLAVAVEDAGFEMRDSIAWLYGSGFPKSLDVSKAIDKRRDWSLVERLSGEIKRARSESGLSLAEVGQATLAATDGTYGKWYHRGGHMFFETGRSLPSRPEWDQLRHVLPIAPEFAEVYDEAERAVIRERTMTQGGGTSLQMRMGEVREVRADITAPATPDAERWQGWGTALKPAFEPIVCARKPLAARGISVLGMVESGLRNQGVEGAIQWTTRPASGAASQSPMPTSGSTNQQPTAATSARNASASATPSTESATASAIATSTASGGPQTPTRSGPTAETPTGDSATPSSTPTAPTACAAAKPSRHSSRSTTSTAAAPSIESRYTERSTPNSAAKDSHPATECFAGIATGLSGSWATVRIDRLADGSFVWPDGLPRFTAGGSTVAANVLEHGTGALNIDACRVEGGARPLIEADYKPTANSAYEGRMDGSLQGGSRHGGSTTQGRWPANVVLDEEMAEVLDEQSGVSKSPPVGSVANTKGGNTIGTFAYEGRPPSPNGHGDSGGASRFFPTFRYQAKAPKSERPRVDGVAHPTVKPLALMRWLVRLVTPPDGVVLDPFAGSGATLEAALLEGFQCVGIELTDEYLPLIVHRIERAQAGHDEGADAPLFKMEGEVG